MLSAWLELLSTSKTWTDGVPSRERQHSAELQRSEELKVGTVSS